MTHSRYRRVFFCLFFALDTLLTSTAVLGSSCMRMSSADTLLLSFFVRAAETQQMITICNSV